MDIKTIKNRMEQLAAELGLEANDIVVVAEPFKVMVAERYNVEAGTAGAGATLDEAIEQFKQKFCKKLVVPSETMMEAA
jgi:hypothetical protein